MARTPKRPGDRVNRRRMIQGEWTTLPAGPYEGPKPRMPSGLHAYARRCWDAWWRMPSAHMWNPAERLELVRLVRLAERIDRDPDCPAWCHSELRMGLDRLGLSTVGRRRNRWDMPDEGEPECGGEVVDARERWAHLRPLDDDDLGGAS